MKLTADKNGSTRYFSAKLGWKERFDSREIEMLYSNTVPALIPPFTVQGRRNNVMRFDISSYTTLEYYLSFALSCEQFSEMMLSCVDIFLHMQRVYLNYKNLVLDLDKIYMQLNDRSLHFVYLPLAESSREASFPEFFRRIISSASRSTHELSMFLDECNVWLQRPTPFTLEEFSSFIRQHMYQVAPAMVSSSTPTPPPSPAGDPFYHPSPTGFDPYAQSPAGSPPIFSGIGGVQSGQTVLLQSPASTDSSASAIRAFLVRQQTGERIPLTSFPFILGTELGFVSYCVSGNAAVSRRHAQLTILGDQIYITDLNSTNKTYVNDCALLPSAPQALDNGARLRLGNEAFTFVLEDS